MSTPRFASSPSPTGDAAAEARRRRSTLLLILVAGLTVMVPLLFWKQTWFGQPLTDAQLAEYLADSTKPRRIQQALVEIQKRIENGDAAAARWYPQVVELKRSPVAALRVTLAWVLGTDTGSELFHQTLLELLRDPDVLVRRNAALSLVRFGDASGHEEITKMLETVAVFADTAGLLRHRNAEGARVDRGTLVARIEQPSGAVAEVRSPVPGRILRRIAPEGAAVSAGQEILAISPDADHAWEALRALVLIGREEDLPLVTAFQRSNDGEYPAKLRQQARLTEAEIRRRSSAR